MNDKNNKYQTKHHMYLCETLRWLTFLSATVTAVLFVYGLWFPFNNPDVFVNMIFTTIAITVLSAFSMIIFKEKEETKK